MSYKSPASENPQSWLESQEFMREKAPIRLEHARFLMKKAPWLKNSPACGKIPAWVKKAPKNPRARRKNPP